MNEYIIYFFKEGSKKRTIMKGKNKNEALKKFYKKIGNFKVYGLFERVKK